MKPMKKMPSMSNTEIRIKAINMVNDYRPVLNDTEYAAAMHMATRVYKDEEGTDLKEVLFDAKAKEICQRMETRLNIALVLMDDSMPKTLRTFYVDTIDRQTQSWEEFKQSFSLK